MSFSRHFLPLAAIVIGCAIVAYAAVSYFAGRTGTHFLDIGTDVFIWGVLGVAESLTVAALVAVRRTSNEDRPDGRGPVKGQARVYVTPRTTRTVSVLDVDGPTQALPAPSDVTSEGEIPRFDFPMPAHRIPSRRRRSS